MQSNCGILVQHGVQARSLTPVFSWGAIWEMCLANSEAYYETDPKKRQAGKLGAWGIVPFMRVQGNPACIVDRMTDKALWSEKCGLDIEAKYFRLLGMKTDDWYDKFVRGREDELHLVLAQRSWSSENADGSDGGATGEFYGLHLIFRRGNETMEYHQQSNWNALCAPSAWETVNGEQREVTYDPSFKDRRRFMILTPVEPLYVDEERLFWKYDPAKDDDSWLFVVNQTAPPLPCLGGTDEDDESPMKTFRRAMAQAGVSETDMTVEGGRHQAVMEVLATGVAKLLSRDELEACVAEITPDYAKNDHADMMNLLNDFCRGGKYYDNVPCQDQQALNVKLFGECAARAQAKEQARAAEKAKKTSGFTPRVMGKPLPDFMEVNAKNYPTGPKILLGYVREDRLPQALTCHSPAWGMCAENISAIGTMGHKEKPLLQSCCIGPTGSGKNELQLGIETIIEEAVKKDAVFRREMDEYKRLQKDKKASERLERPKGYIRVIALDATNAARAQLLTMGEGHVLYSCESEMGHTFSEQESRGSGGFSPIKFLNNSWSKERVMIDRASADGVSASIIPMLNMTGFAQPKYIPFFANYLEQGWVSRVIWTHIGSQLYQMPQPVRQISESDSQTVRDFVREMMAIPPTELKLPQLKNALLQWMKDTLNMAKDSQNCVLGDPGVVGRFACNAFRTGLWMRAAAMVDGSKGGDSSILCRQMQWMASYWADEYEQLFGSFVRRNSEREAALTFTFEPFSRGVSEKDVLLSQLPEKFTKDDLLKQRPDMSDANARKTLSRWGKQGKIMKEGGLFKKKQIAA